jgi:hypothetical protein
VTNEDDTPAKWLRHIARGLIELRASRLLR